MFYPIDAITESVEITNVGSFNFDNGGAGYKTILGVSITQSGSQSESAVVCAGDTIALNYAKDLPFVAMHRNCYGLLKADKTGTGDSAFFIVTYVPYDMSISTTAPYFTNGFSFDGILIGFILFLMFSLQFFGGLWNRIDGTKIKKSSYNKFIGNNSQDGKIIYYD